MSSNAQDTYYALRILAMLEVKPRNVERTVGFLQGLQREDGNFDSVKVAFYVIMSLSQFSYSLAKNAYLLMRSFDVILRGLSIQAYMWRLCPNLKVSIWLSI